MGEDLNFDTVITFSDGAPTQYKNRVAFVDCSHAPKDLGVDSQRHFFGSRHGKGPCDRETGVIKKCLKMAVAAGSAHISSPLALYAFCCKRLCLPRPGTDHSHIKRRFLFVATADIDRERPTRTETKRLKDTQKMHCVKSIQPFVVAVRERSCFCQGCRHDGPCVNSDIAGEWMVTQLKPPKKRGKLRQPDASGDCATAPPDDAAQRSPSW